jgi:hypothetical protein
MRLGDTFTGLGLNARPRWDDNGNPAGGDNDCFSLTHYDKKDVKDPNAEWPQMKPVTEQKYTVDGKKYMVGLTRTYYTGIILIYEHDLLT